MGDGFLHKYFLRNFDKALHKWVHYFDIYEHHFERFRGKSPTMIEIGVSGGGSLAMWKDYFGQGSTIIGVDADPQCKMHEAEDIEIFIGSQDDPQLFASILDKYPDIDIVLDDGSHIMHHMIATFDILYHKIQPLGIYMAEDIHTSYFEEYGGRLKGEGTFMEFTKNKMDELNAIYTRQAVPVSDFTRSTFAITCYDSILVFEKRPQGARVAPITGTM